MQDLVNELIETHGKPDDDEYRWLKSIYELIASSKDIDEAENRLKEMRRFISSMYGYVSAKKRLSTTPNN